MLMHTKGILVMTPTSAMVLTGKQALDFSGGVSAEDNFGIGGFDRVMGPNGQAQYWAPTLRGGLPDPDAALRPQLRRPGRAVPAAGEDASIRSTATCATSPHAAMPGSDLRLVGDVFSAALQRASARARSTSARSCARSPTPTPTRSSGGPGGEGRRRRSSGTPTSGASRCACWGWSPGPWPGAASCPPTVRTSWTSGTLFPQSSRKTARAINAASGNRPLVVLANLSGFDGSPESMRRWQLEYGAEIGRAVTNFDGPIVFVVISRYHGGCLRRVLQEAQPGDGDRCDRGLLRLGDRWRTRRRDGVRARGQVPDRERPAGGTPSRRGRRGDRCRGRRPASRARPGARRRCARRSWARWRTSSTPCTRSSGR